MLYVCSLRTVVTSEWVKFSQNLNGYTNRAALEKLKSEIDAKIKELQDLINVSYRMFYIKVNN